jgi:hypothetical protein
VLGRADSKGDASNSFDALDDSAPVSEFAPQCQSLQKTLGSEEVFMLQACYPPEKVESIRDTQLIADIFELYETLFEHRLRSCQVTRVAGRFS